MLPKFNVWFVYTFRMNTLKVETDAIFERPSESNRIERKALELVNRFTKFGMTRQPTNQQTNRFGH